ncbi:MAG: Cof-type HAD-IIB family hydrolase [Candidatus Dormibacteria bacterium]
MALDLDGTCLDGRQRLHPRTREAVQRLAGRGVHVVVATGRMYRSALPWARRLDLRDPIICYQGAVTRALPGPGAAMLDGVPLGELIAEDPVPAGVASAVIQCARAEGWHRQAYRDELLLCEQDRPETHLYARIAQVPITYVPDLLLEVSHGSTKLICVIEDEAEAGRAEAILGNLLGSRARVTRSLPPFVEITSPRASKGQALIALCRHLGVDMEATVAVGDAPNDIDMLAAAGLAIAVRDSRPEVLAVADSVCAPPEEAGVADVLEEMFGG